MSYTEDGVMAQIWVAFGQGTGAMRVSQEAALELRARYLEHIHRPRTSDGSTALENWDQEAVQILERIRAIGRLAAFKAMERGAPTVSRDDVSSSAETVETTSDTDRCPPPLPS
jgi:hypothetical protein